MTEQKEIKEMNLGELINSLVNLKKEFQDKIVDENHPYPETWDKCGGIGAYNQQIMKEYKQRQTELILELDKREQLYSGK